jgi:protocatechuate 3,4-dioxygenase, alpha subunit
MKETPSQTAGPFVHIGTVPNIAGLKGHDRARQDVLDSRANTAEHIRLEGVVYDGSGAPVIDAMLEIWQADQDGRFGTAEFGGWGRAVTDFKTGLCSFQTIKPGPVDFHDGRKQAPHIWVSIFARGINLHLQTRLYFSDEAAANAEDPVLKLVGDPALIATLIAQRQEGSGVPIYRFDIRLQGERETVFFDV